MKKQVFSFILLFILISTSFYSQKTSNAIGNPNPPAQQTYCRTEPYMDPDNIPIMNNTSEYIDMSHVHACVKLYFHVIRQSNGTGGQSISNVNQAFQILKSDFRPHDILFDWDGTIDYINNSTLYNSPSSSVFNINRHTDGVDIYLFPDTSPAGGLANGVGTSSELYVSGSYWNYPYGSLITSHVISHELGHVLGLWHTHHGTYPEGGNDNPCPELVNGSNSASCGDYVIDTPADPHIMFNVNTSCAWLGSGTDANGQSYNPDTHNIMSYSSPSCMSYFSYKQGWRMKKALMNLPYLQALSRIGYGALDATVQECNFIPKTITLYPNPVGDILNVKIEGNVTGKADFEIYDFNNNKITFGKLISKNDKISTNKLKDGYYILRLYVDGEVITKKIIVNHKK